MRRETRADPCPVKTTDVEETGRDNLRSFMYPEVEVFVETLRLAEEKRDADNHANQQMWDVARRAYRSDAAATNQAQAHYTLKNDAIRRAHRAAVDTAWLTLAETTDKVLVKWLALSVSTEYRQEHVYNVLLRLPATLDELRTMARERGWCGVYDQLVRQAMQEGVIEDTRVPEYRSLETWIARNLNHHYVEDLKQLVEAYVTAEVDRRANGGPVEPLKQGDKLLDKPLLPVVEEAPPVVVPMKDEAQNAEENAEEDAVCASCDGPLSSEDKEQGEEYCSDCRDEDEEDDYEDED